MEEEVFSMHPALFKRWGFPLLHLKTDNKEAFTFSWLISQVSFYYIHKKQLLFLGMPIKVLRSASVTKTMFDQ